MSKSNSLETSLLALLFNATAIANIADNAALAPLTNLYVSLHTGDPGEGGAQTASEATYTSYARVAGQAGQCRVIPYPTPPPFNSRNVQEAAIRSPISLSVRYPRGQASFCIPGRLRPHWRCPAGFSRNSIWVISRSQKRNP